MDEWWDEEYIRELYEEYVQYKTDVFEKAQAVYKEYLTDYIAQEVNASLSEGGALYNFLLQSAITSAEQWYGLYTPMHYKRRGTLSNPANISISSSFSSRGGEITGAWNLDNMSDQAEYAKSGFWIYTRSGKIWRPGGLEDGIPEELPMTIDVAEVSADLTERAFYAVM